MRTITILHAQDTTSKRGKVHAEELTAKYAKLRERTATGCVPQLRVLVAFLHAGCYATTARMREKLQSYA